MANNRDIMPEFLHGLVPAFLALHQEMFRGLTTALRASNESSASLAQPIVFALALGALHALTPGHGKAILFSYFLGRHARPFAGLAAGLRIAFSHVCIAVLLVGFFETTVGVSGRSTGAAATVETLAYVVIAASGAWLFLRAIARAKNRGQDTSLEKSRHLYPALAGLIPCPLTMLLLVYALARADVWIAIILVTFLAIGITATLSLIAILTIVAREFFLGCLDHTAQWYLRLTFGLEIVSASAILIIGMLLLMPRVAF